jgi:CRISPR-associated endonuclease/helicase Cas3
MSHTNPSYFKYWGKAKSNPSQVSVDYHLLPYHCLDVAAVADAWLTHSKVLLKQISQQIDKPEAETRAIILFFVLLHDLGKFDARFQNFVEPIRLKLQGDEYEVEPEKYSHGSYGYLHFRREYDSNQAMKAVAGHHGYCDTSIDFFEPDADEELIELDILARKEWIEFCLQWLGLNEIPDVGEIAMLAGLCSVADWIGSSITNFTTDPNLNMDDYYQQTLLKATEALIESGMVANLKGAGFEFLFEDYRPRGIQTLIPQLPLEVGLTIVESDTGSGKTEFALAYASLLIEQGLADGVVFGLPTQATANGLFDRIGDAAEKLFPDSTVTLAHSKAKYLLKDKYLVPDENGFLHQSSKRAFLGSMSVATVDQILMGVLGIKHQFVRSFGTRKSVLILDEIHSFDAYMYGLIEQVLKGQHQAFSSVILLSATLPKSLKNKLLQPYGGAGVSDTYPLITHTNMKNLTTEFTLTNATEPKNISIETWRSDNLLPNTSQQQKLIKWAEEGAMVGVICNTVNDAQQFYSLLQAHSATIDIDLFHARFTYADRAKIERQVLNTYGKKSTRQGRILVATQVVEQSLDLDFDVMISQIAPIEFLMQRMGRLWRHDRLNTELAERSSAIKTPNFITLLPNEEVTDWKTHYQGSGFVYSNIRLLYRTEQYLQQHQILSFPDCYREAIEYAHHETELSGEPIEFIKLYQEYTQAQEGVLYAAKMNSNLDSKPLNDVDPRCALLTRDGEMSGTVVLVTPEGELYHGGDYNEQKDRENSTISLAKKHVRGIKDEKFYCTKAVIGRDINYTELGVVV